MWVSMVLMLAAWSGERGAAQLDRESPSAVDASWVGMVLIEGKTIKYRWGEFSRLASEFVSHAHRYMLFTAREVGQQGQLGAVEGQETAEASLITLAPVPLQASIRFVASLHHAVAAMRKRTSVVRYLQERTVKPTCQALQTCRNKS